MTSFTLLIILMLDTGLVMTHTPEQYADQRVCAETAQQAVEEFAAHPDVIDAMTVCIETPTWGYES